MKIKNISNKISSIILTVAMIPISIPVIIPKSARLYNDSGVIKSNKFIIDEQKNKDDYRIDKEQLEINNQSNIDMFKNKQTIETFDSYTDTSIYNRTGTYSTFDIDTISNTGTHTTTCLFSTGKEENQTEETASAEQKQQKTLDELIVPTITKATLIKDVKLTESISRKSKAVGYLEKGTEVEIIRDRLYKRYLIKSGELQGWVDRDALYIHPEEELNLEPLTKEQAEEYINNSGLSSETEYLLWVDVARQTLNIFKQNSETNKWELYKSMICATGKAESPTIRGIFKLKDRGLWFYSESFNAGAKYWVRIEDSYLIHSVPMDKNKRILDNTLGKRVSSGCIRLSVEDAKWVYYNIPKDTTIYIN